MSDTATWVDAGIAGIAAAGAAVSWWRSNLSRKARTQAARSEEDARRSLAAVEAQAQEVAKLARRFELPPLAIEWTHPEVFVLRNTTDADLRIEEILTDLTCSHLDLSVPVTIAPGESCRGYLVEALGDRRLDEISLRVANRDAPLIISLTGRPT